MARHIRIVLSVLTIWVHFSQCQAKITTTDAANTTTSATNRLGWVSPSSSRRSTWDIIWGCLAIFIICSWKATHLNIPSIAESQCEWYKWHRMPYWPKPPLWHKWGRKIGFMLLIAIAPEIVVGLATWQYMEARADLKRVASRENKNQKYTMAHAFYANMGGFILKIQEGGGETQTFKAEESEQKKDNINPEPFQPADHDVKKATNDVERSEIIATSPTNVTKYKVLRLGTIEFLEGRGIAFDVEEEDIKDRAKASVLTKLFAIIQAGWLFLQSIARKISGLQISELELMTMAFTACAFATYILWWDKPFDAERAIVFCCPESRREEVNRSFKDDEETDSLLSPENYPWKNKDSRVEDLSLENITTMALGVFDPDMIMDAEFTSSLALYATGAAFSAIHVAAWNWSFPQPVI